MVYTSLLLRQGRVIVWRVAAHAGQSLDFTALGNMPRAAAAAAAAAIKKENATSSPVSPVATISTSALAPMAPLGGLPARLVTSGAAGSKAIPAFLTKLHKLVDGAWQLGGTVDPPAAPL